MRSAGKLKVLGMVAMPWAMGLAMGVGVGGYPWLALVLAIAGALYLAFVLVARRRQLGLDLSRGWLVVMWMLVLATGFFGLVMGLSLVRQGMLPVVTSCLAVLGMAGMYAAGLANRRAA